VEIGWPADVCNFFVAAKPGSCKVKGGLPKIGAPDDGGRDITEVGFKVGGKEGSEVCEWRGVEGVGFDW
jgi:hypothetical protein